MAGWKDPEQLLRTWLARAQEARNGHRITAKHYARFHWLIGSLVVVLSAATGTALAASLQNTGVGRWGLAVLSAVVALLAAFQTFREFDKVAQRHESARAGFASVCRDIEQVFALAEAERGEPGAVLTRLRARLDELANLSAPIPERLWLKARAEEAVLQVQRSDQAK